MTDDYKIQLSSTINGNLLNLRANSADELKELVEGLATNLDDIISAFGQVKSGIVAKDIFTGNASSPKGAQATASAGSTSTSSGDGPPRCKHGEMKDLEGKGYKFRYYCPERDRDKQCKAQN